MAIGRSVRRVLKPAVAQVGVYHNGDLPELADVSNDALVELSKLKTTVSSATF